MLYNTLQCIPATTNYRVSEKKRNPKSALIFKRLKNMCENYFYISTLSTSILKVVEPILLILCFLSYMNTYPKSYYIPKFELHCSIGSHVRSKTPF